MRRHIVGDELHPRSVHSKLVESVQNSTSYIVLKMSSLLLLSPWQHAARIEFSNEQYSSKYFAHRCSLQYIFWLSVVCHEWGYDCWLFFLCRLASAKRLNDSTTGRKAGINRWPSTDNSTSRLTTQLISFHTGDNSHLNLQFRRMHSMSFDLLFCLYYVHISSRDVRQVCKRLYLLTISFQIDVNQAVLTNFLVNMF